MTIAAVTTQAPVLPAYINFSLTEDGGVKVTVRGDPAERDGVRICGQTCHPGGEHCNNYCNMAPGKGPMQDAPLSHRITDAGPLAVTTLTAQEWASLRAAILAAG